jgi:hypothetical protein
MLSEDMLVGQLALASVVIKTVLSTLKSLFTVPRKALRIGALSLGILISFMLEGESVLNLPENSTLLWRIVNNTITGIFVGTAAIGTHEATKLRK